MQVNAILAAIPDQVQHKNGKIFSLCAKQTVTKAFFFDIVDVGLYYPDCTSNRSIFDEQNKLLRFSYLREVTGKQFKEGAEEFLQKNLSQEQQQHCLASYQEINESYLDVQEGDFYDLFQIDEIGLDLYLNGQSLASLDSKSCESLYFNIWFGEESMSADFSKLLK
ncbi:MAG: chalcone isomerase family protein [Kangiellaceae bacterium]|nr:chalcone isomerase family protein [Kangiellaceae bacterium]